MTTTAELPRLTFSDYQLSVDVGFWEELRRLKLMMWKLEEPFASLHGSIRTNVSNRALLTPANVVHLSSAAFEVAPSEHGAVNTFTEVVDVQMRGKVKNYNFPEGLKSLDSRNALLSLVAEYMLKPALADNLTAEEEEESWSQIPFCMVSMYTYIDAKSYRFFHKEAFPSIALDGSILIKAAARESADSLPFSLSAAQAIYDHGVARLRSYPERGCNPFLSMCSPPALPVFKALSPRALSVAEDDAAHVILCFFDFSDAAETLCLSARNLITCVRLAVPSLTSLSVYALRSGGPAKSLFLQLAFDAVDQATVTALKLRLTGAAFDKVQGVNWKEEFPSLKVSGWRKKKVEGLDLGAFIDPVRRADSDSRFNLELMKWRVLPSLELSRLADCKVLLLGTGTLGCNVARNLLMWGVRHFTLVDRGNVSFSNLARQSLFTFEDAKQNKSKVDAAAEALRSIIPSVVVRPVPLTIHMPGHRVDEGKLDEVLGEVHLLEELIGNSDVVFLLTDSREARWMPTLISAACGTPVVNVALGFDTYVVMRHGVPSAANSRSNAVRNGGAAATAPAALGCYFCSDVVAPTDSLSFRALDEQCTVTRPAVSSIASAIAVELVAEVYQHPDGFCCPAYRESASGDTDTGKCRLGVIPQQIRGSVFSHSMHHLCGERNPFCTACSDKLLDAYRAGGAAFLLRCVNTPMDIEEVCGVKELKESWETDVKEMCWSSDEEWVDS
ncbi:putative ubiquitin activating E1 enzyme [Leptomonas pyrrhocoris]|uniref:Ubiquitin-like modifier-activating enzyme ATG7 n=1 Tax=Leptomonas pyrrhocoris TaxID=157538 RepID=A0A0M9FP61_LEPPY|nr:putative ubiquitin activating E1 enzyme [Leptomonas pyrrhocoris]KPA73240.1 putative ubiquitin activating E1 enzyme [Leptomonas pyrrhocoris]|eukprot:XP_015651679.1 putative ubiquitin activating E1 enzyme [Leptomonas pyrrhocoris]